MKTKLIVGAAALLVSVVASVAGGIRLSVNVGGGPAYCAPRYYCPPPVTYCAPVYYYSYPVVSAYNWGPNVVAYQGPVSSGFTTVTTSPNVYVAPPIYRVPPPLRPVPAPVANFGWRH